MQLVRGLGRGYAHPQKNIYKLKWCFDAFCVLFKKTVSDKNFSKHKNNGVYTVKMAVTAPKLHLLLKM